jgi:predicted amidophosphoribosyltransferase
MVCPDCQTQAASFAEYCNKCGADLHKVKANNRKNQIKVWFWAF